MGTHGQSRGSPDDDKYRRIVDYGSAYRADYGFESVMVGLRQKQIVELIGSLKPEVVVEIGCGTELLFDAVEDRLQVGSRPRQWVIVEPNPDFVRNARAGRSQDSTVQSLSVIEGFLEESIPAVLEQCSSGPDLIICSSVLHEVENPFEVLAAAKTLMTPRCLLHVNVPNALSLHRRLAVAMGLISDPHELGDRNRRLEQYRVFDLDGLRSLITDSGFETIESGGCFLKPFTYEQLEQIEFLDARMIEGLYTLGRELPELAAEIFVNARIGTTS